jgi:predicted transcriptional regulator
MIGRDGVMGVGSALDDQLSLNKVVVQVPGPASVIDPAHLRDAAKKSDPLRSLLAKHELLIHAQAQQSAACNATHDISERMCRWLARMSDLIGNHLSLTQEYLAQMLGVRRTSVTLIASKLQQAGFIKCSRGNIHVRDADGLRESACECYETVKDQYRTMMKTDLSMRIG